MLSIFPRTKKKLKKDRNKKKYVLGLRSFEREEIFYNFLKLKKVMKLHLKLMKEKEERLN
jgi:hypothetical protein